MTRDQQRRAWQAFVEWKRSQVTKGVDGPVPPRHPEHSDYNLHVPELEASGVDWDAFDTRMRDILGLPPLVPRTVESSGP